MPGDAQHIEVLFAETDRTVAIDLDPAADSSFVIDALAMALEVDNPVDAERQLGEALNLGEPLR
jgi:hypothetical protein